MQEVSWFVLYLVSQSANQSGLVGSSVRHSVSQFVRWLVR